MTTPTHKWIAPLDGWRGIAVLAVVAFHSAILGGGWLGVDLFFVLSGYLITLRLVNEHQRTDRVSLKEFWRRRFRRLGPALIVFLVGTAALVAWWPTPQLLPSNLTTQFVGTITYAANWVTLSTQGGYWDGYSVGSPLRHMWSLSIEEQFYIVFPVMFIALIALGRRYVVAGLAVLTIASWGWALTLLAGGTTFERVYLGTDTRLGAITLGALAGWMVAQKQPVRWLRFANRLAPLAFITIITLGVALSGEGDWSPGRWGLVIVFELAVTILLIAGTMPGWGSSVINKLVSNKTFVWFGAISYGLYLWHIPVQMVVNHNWPQIPNVTVFVATLAGGTLLGWLSLKYVETPIRTKGLAAIPRVPVGVLAGGATLVVILSGYSIYQNTTQARTNAERPAMQIALAPNSETKSPGTPKTSQPETNTTAPTTVNTPKEALPVMGENARVLLVGDSMSRELTGSLVYNENRYGVTASATSHIGCSVGGIEPTEDSPMGAAKFVQECENWRNNFGQYTTQSAADIVLLIRGSHRDNINGNFPCTKEYSTWYRQELAKEITTLEQNGASVVLINHAYDRYYGNNPEKDRYVDCLNIDMAQVAKTEDVILIDYYNWICPNGQCRKEHNGVVLRPDGLHLQGDGGVVMLEWVFDILRNTIKRG